MNMIPAIVIIIVITYYLLLDIINKNERFWAFALFYQHIPLIIFHKLGSEFLGIVYFIVVILLFYFRQPKIILKKHRLRNPIFISILFLIIALLIHYIIIGINIDNPIGYETFYKFFIYNVPIVFICLFVISSDEKTMMKLIEGIILYGVIFILTVLFVSGLVDITVYDRGSFRDDFRISALAAAQTAGIIIIATFFKFINENKIRERFISVSIMILSFILLFITASRAALIFLLIVMGVYYGLSDYRKRTKFAIILLSTFLGIIIYYTIINLNLPVIDRLVDLKNYDQMLRYTRFEIIFELVINFEMGIWGLGPYGFGYLTGLQYPHNYISELVVDYGILGIISATLLIIFGLYYSIILIKNKHHYAYVFLGIMFIYLFLAVQTTGDIIYARSMQFTGILLANIIMRKKIK